MSWANSAALRRASPVWLASLTSIIMRLFPTG